MQQLSVSIEVCKQHNKLIYTYACLEINFSPGKNTNSFRKNWEHLYYLKLFVLKYNSKNTKVDFQYFIRYVSQYILQYIITTFINILY